METLRRFGKQRRMECTDKWQYNSNSSLKVNGSTAENNAMNLLVEIEAV